MPNAFKTEFAPGNFNARRAILAAEIAAVSGADAETAGVAAGSFLTFPRDPQHGLGDAPSGWVLRYIAAGRAVSVWLKSKAAPAVEMAVAA